MKAFEERYPQPEERPGLMSECPLMDWYGKEEVWRAALEWVIGEHGPLDERVHNCDYARGRIKNELEN